ncbi:hypothetical protein KY332_03910 [Candidatus Woesearchaeota archaeon]|nr:hypothetical protein [Candidatus Woesearchaeota archaeon]
MAMKIISQTEQPLLSRTKIEAHITFEAQTPSNEDVAKDIAKQTKKDVKLVVVKKIDTHYGSKEADVDAVVYESEEAKTKIEPKPKEKKAAPGAKAEAAPAEKPAEAKKEEAEAPKEEAKEEKPAEKEEAPAESEKPEEKAGKEKAE